MMSCCTGSRFPQWSKFAPYSIPIFSYWLFLDHCIAVFNFPLGNIHPSLTPWNNASLPHCS